MKELFGVTTAMVTPIDENNEVDYEAVRQLTEMLIDKGVNCLYPCGTTGEMLRLTVDERKKIAETVVEMAAGRVNVFIHCGCMRQEDTIELVKHAKTVGADGAGIVTPAFFGVNDEEMKQYYLAVGESVKDFPLYLYNIPQCAVTVSYTHLDVYKRQQLQSEGVDCIISYTDDAEVALTARQIYELGLDVPVIASAGIVTQQVLDLVEPEYVEGWYAVTDFISTNDSTEVAEFVKNYQDAYGTEPEIFASSYYSATYVLADAIERAGSDDPEAIRAALMETEDLVLPEGTYTCDEGGAMVHGCVVAQIQDKVPVMIDYVTAE